MDRMPDLGRLRQLAGGMQGPPGGAAGTRALGAGMGLIAGGAVLWNSLFNVEAGHRAIMFNRFAFTGEKGIDTRSVIEEGTHFAMPWFQRPIIYDCRTRPNTFTSLTGSKDLQMVNIAIRVLTKPQSDKLPAIYDFLGTDKDMDSRVLPSVVPEVLKAVRVRPPRRYMSLPLRSAQPGKIHWPAGPLSSLFAGAFYPVCMCIPALHARPHTNNRLPLWRQDVVQGAIRPAVA
eukprot:COSAG01_NODE_11481_length_1925_cov_63.721796_2_plen_232_part_00